MDQVPKAQMDELSGGERQLLDCVLSLFAEENCTMRPVENRERYDAASPSLKRLGIDVDAWPCPHAGLSVDKKRTLYFRLRTRLTVVHEIGHAFDCARGNDVYRSGCEAEFRASFTSATRFVSTCAARGTDEDLAEVFHNMCSANDPSSHWPNVS